MSFRVLVIIISSEGEAYRRFKENWKIYANSHPNIDTYFIEMNEIENEYEIKDRTIRFKGTDSIVPGCLDKTIKSLNHFDLSKYSYVVRTNLSSVIHFPRLYNELCCKPRQKYYAGVLFKHSYDVNRQLTSFDHPIFCSGALFIMSIDVTIVVANEKNYMDTAMYDDVYIGNAIIKHFKSRGGIILSSLNRVDNKIIHTDPKCFHYRFRTNNRIKDTIQHRIIIESIYGKPKIDSTSLITSKYQKYLQSSNSDLLITLYNYASQVSNIATHYDNAINWALLAGLADSSKDKSRRLRVINSTLDSSITPLATATRKAEIDFLFLRDQAIESIQADMHVITSKLNRKDITSFLDSSQAGKIIIYIGDMGSVLDSSKIWRRVKVCSTNGFVIWKRVQ